MQECLVNAIDTTKILIFQVEAKVAVLNPFFISFKMKL